VPEIDAGSIVMLKVALIAVFTATAVAPFAGIVDTTEGTVTVSSPQPATKTNNRPANKDLIPNPRLLILIPLASTAAPQCLKRIEQPGCAER
jgi:hypothetical protein